MSKSRLEAFSDGVLAIIITIMVLELRAPAGGEFSDFVPLIPTFLSYVVSFVYIAIYWNNHHHLIHAAKKVTGGLMWANIHLLFWLSLIPFSTSWAENSGFSKIPMASYGLNLLMAGFAYFVLTQNILKSHSSDSPIKKAIGKDFKGTVSLFAYLSAVFASFFSPLIAGSIYVAVAIFWLIPDTRIERALLDNTK